MKTIHLTGKEPLIADLARMVGYTGRRFSLQVAQSVNCSMNRMWSEGSRSTFTMIRLADMQVLSLPEQGMFSPEILGMREVPLPLGFVVIEVCEGRWSDMQIWVGPEGTAPLLPPVNDDLSMDERIVLHATATLKSSYGPYKDLRFTEAQRYTAISRARYDEAKATLIAKKLLNKAGAITPAGRNADKYHSFYDLKKDLDCSVTS